MVLEYTYVVAKNPLERVQNLLLTIKLLVNYLTKLQKFDTNTKFGCL